MVCFLAFLRLGVTVDETRRSFLKYLFALMMIVVFDVAKGNVTLDQPTWAILFLGVLIYLTATIEVLSREVDRLKDFVKNIKELTDEKASAGEPEHNLSLMGGTLKNLWCFRLLFAQEVVNFSVISMATVLHVYYWSSENGSLLWTFVLVLYGVLLVTCCLQMIIKCFGTFKWTFLPDGNYKVVGNVYYMFNRVGFVYGKLTHRTNMANIHDLIICVPRDGSSSTPRILTSDHQSPQSSNSRSSSTSSTSSRKKKGRK